MKRIIKYLGLPAALLSGVMLAMCFPGYDVPGLVWVWAMPLMAALWLGTDSKRPRRRGFALGWFSGFVFWSINLIWLKSMGDLDGVPMGAAVFSWLGMAAYLAVYFGIWGTILATIGNPWRSRNSKTKESKKSGIEKRIEEKLASSRASQQKISGKKKFDLMRGFGKSMRVMRFALLHASVWVVLEWLRGWLFTGFGWNGLAVPLHAHGPVSQAADLVGVAGISFLPILVASMFTQLAKRLYDEVRAGRFSAHWEIPITIGLVTLTFLYGVMRIAHFKSVKTLEVRVLLLQENIPQSLKWGDEAQQIENYLGYEESLVAALKKLKQENLKRALERVKSEGGSFELEETTPDVVIMPESSFTMGINYLGTIDRIYLDALDDDFLKNHILPKGNLSLIFGSNLYDGEVYENGIGGGRQVRRKLHGRDYNALLVASPEAKKESGNPYKHIEAYAKVHLVPFGEYYPEFPGSKFIYSLAFGDTPQGSFSTGNSYEPLDLNVRGQHVSIIPAVCFEDTVGRVTRKFVRNEPQMIVNITNDGWFGKSIAARQHMSNALFRAIELRRPMVRAANTGMSGIIDMTGSFSDSVSKKRQIIEDENGNIFTRDSLFGYARVPLEPEWTLYAMFGDWFVILCAMLSITLMVLIRLKNKKDIEDEV